MYYKGQIAGLSPDTRYRVQFEIEIATSVPNGCVGVGGAPGEGVTVKAGVTDIEPDRIDSGSGGAVFSVGSISWCGSLAVNGFDNNVSRITENVLRRFAAPERFC